MVIRVSDIRNLKKFSISNLILIILNDKNNGALRKYAELELRDRIKNVNWSYDDFLHFDDRVIKVRGYDVKNYLISPSVNMQQLMETYFMYGRQDNYEDKCLLFSEKHLCNRADFAESFFTKICDKEIKNLDKRLDIHNDKNKIQLLSYFKQLLEERQMKSKSDKKETFKEGPIDELICCNDAMCQLDDFGGFYDAYCNYSDEELHKICNSIPRFIKFKLLIYLNESSLFDSDLFQSLYGLKFVLKDNSKLKEQRKQLMCQAKNGFEVDYESKTMKQALNLLQKMNLPQVKNELEEDYECEAVKILCKKMKKDDGNTMLIR